MTELTPPAPLRCPPPTHVAYNWEVCEALTLAMDERDGEFTTEIFFYESALGADENHGTERSAAEARVAALLLGKWREYFDEAVVAEIDARIEEEAEAARLDALVDDA